MSKEMKGLLIIFLIFCGFVCLYISNGIIENRNDIVGKKRDSAWSEFSKIPESRFGGNLEWNNKWNKITEKIENEYPLELTYKKANTFSIIGFLCFIVAFVLMPLQAKIATIGLIALVNHLNKEEKK